MSDTSGYDDTATTPAAAAYPSIVVPQPEIDTDRATGFLKQHQAAGSAAESRYEDIMKQRQAAVGEARATLDKTIQELRDRHSGAGPGQANLPLLSLASGMLSGSGPGAGNFGAQLGRGLGEMGKTIAGQRMADTEFLNGIAELQQKSAKMADVPLKDAAELQKQRQLKEEAAGAGIEKALITSKADKPFSLGSGILMDPKSNKIVNAFTGEEISLDPSKIAPGTNGKSLIGSDVHGDEFLKSITSPAMRQAVKGFGDYDEALPPMGRSPQAAAYMQTLFALAKQYNPDFDAKQYPTIQKGMKDWTGNGTMNQRAVSAATTAGHLGNLQEAAASLDNGDFKKFNNVANWIQNNKGDPRVVAFESAKKAVMTEMSSFLGKGHPAEGQIHSWEDTINSANSPQQLQAALNQFSKIMHTQLETMASSKTRDLGGKKQYKPEDLIGESGAHVVADVMNNDISTPGGRLNVIRRGENLERKLKGLEPLPQPTAEQWSANVEKLKKVPTKENRAYFDQSFGPGSAARALGK